MIAGILSIHTPLTRDYPGAPPPPPAPPAPPDPPIPPLPEPIAFSAVTRGSLFGITGAATGSITLATITCADASMTIRLSEAVPGLIFTYAANVLTVAGTPTTPTGVHRVVVSYIASGAIKTIRGSTEHVITIVSASEVLTIGSMAGASGRVGVPMVEVLASPSTNFAVDVTAAATSLVPGVSPLLAWTRGSSTGAGVLAAVGIPTLAGTYSLVVDYRMGTILLGTSTHAIVIAAAYQAPAPAPAPTPAPPAPSPSPPPAPAPAPAPGLGPDPMLSSVRALLRFNADTGLAYDHRENTFTNTGVSTTSGAVAEAGLFSGAEVGPPTFIKGQVNGCDGSDSMLTAECMVDIGASAWAALTAAGQATRFCPVVTYVSADGAVVWSLGFGSWVVSQNGVISRIVIALHWTALSSSQNIGSQNNSVLCISDRIIADRPARFVHLAHCRKPHLTDQFVGATWIDGYPGLSGGLAQQVKLVSAAAGSVLIGGAIPRIEYLLSTTRDVEGVAFSGAIDEVRITAASRYSAKTGTSPSALLASDRVIPWPNY